MKNRRRRVEAAVAVWCDWCCLLKTPKDRRRNEVKTKETEEKHREEKRETWREVRDRDDKERKRGRNGERRGKVDRSFIALRFDHTQAHNFR